jgi:hypothetical protein
MLLMKIIYGDVLLSGMCVSVPELLCESASNGITFIVCGSDVEIPECAENKTERLDDLIITEISRDDDFISIFGYTKDEPLLIIRCNAVLLNQSERELAELAVESGIETDLLTGELQTDGNMMTSLPGVFSIRNSNSILIKKLSSTINNYLIENDLFLLNRA